MSGTRRTRDANRAFESVDVPRAVELIRAGGVVAYPTEAVFGLGCDPSNAAALRRILAIKGRAAEKGFILVAADAGQLAPWLAPLEPAWRSRMDLAWPGPVTFVVPAARDAEPARSRGDDADVPADVTADGPAGGRAGAASETANDAASLLRGGRTTIAVRVSAHPVVRALCEGCGHPLVSTSANASGRPALTEAVAVARELGIGDTGVDAIVAGTVGGRKTPSTIVDVRTGRRLR